MPLAVLVGQYLFETILVVALEVAERACFSATSAASRILSVVGGTDSNIFVRI
jgi:hypothetical protein